jgi:histone acetyltransferase (RNA polymerase elongator complex component)
MKVKRTYKSLSLKRGQEEIVDEATVREVFGQTSVAHHGSEAECGKEHCVYCCEPSLQRLLAGATVETFFSKWELIEA